MTNIQPYQDLTGTMSQEDINTQDISNLMNEFNISQNAQSQNRSVNGTDYYYDSNGINYMQIGILPDGTGGVVIAIPGKNVADLFV